ncbi:SLAC1 anion channel family protein [Gymnodinialimonas ceratoperidinii]|uniref:SLAC1 anion channel family protein n=1 Tax=Gymnodinialimonas ceratoperidinii TaxID=2856823 RepID=A0A8F6TZV9_9RHOB|nr:SLAC1 anion channel family protein [Gymnodinialimonas ceratoperidinii]QXT41069.1 SLAC1 anion channel family protein [Gymnodinialimonas ceratoperidinii]
MTAGVHSKLEHTPISFFTTAMGAFGLSLAARAGGFEVASSVVGAVATALLVILFAVFALKFLRHRAAVVAEWSHPVKLAFFPAASISLLLMASFLHPIAPEAARPVWLLGAALQGVLTVVVISAWISHRAFGPGQLSPAWFIPAVGNVMAPFGGIPLGYIEFSWYFFAVGILFWLVLLTLVFNRLIFHDPMPGKLRPTIVILIAPPALAFLTWVQFHNGSIDAAARVLINLGYFFTALVALQMPAILRLPFALSFWALSFPLAAITIASFRFAELTGSLVHLVMGYGLLAVLAIVLAVLTVHTARAIVSGAVFQPD